MSVVSDIVKEQGWKLLLILIGVVSLALSFLFEQLEAMVWLAILFCGTPIIIGAILGLLEDHDITADVLVAIAIVASYLIGQPEAAAEIAVIMQIGSFLEEATVSRANSGIRELIGMRPKTIRTVSGDGELMVDVGKVRIGDTVRVIPGETIPVDGTVISGSTSVDTSAITGESVPVDITAGDRVSAGSVNMFGSIDIRVDRTEDDSTVARMARLMENAAGRSQIVRTADRWARYIVAIAFTVSILTYIVTGDITRSVTVLVVFCPCALILATPTAIMAAAGNLSRRGILVRDGGALERIAAVDTVVLDKTGTLTTGNIRCTGVVSTSDMGPETIGRLVASVERRSEHPLGKAIASHLPGSPEPESFEYIPGKGVRGRVDGHIVTAGNRRLMEEFCEENLGAATDGAQRDILDGTTIVYAGIDGRTVGYVTLSDTVRPSSRRAVADIRTLGLETIMMTGDSGKVAGNIRDALGLDDAVWECLPEDKFGIVDRMESDRNICMVGDGINDAPSLKRADVGIAMGGMGSDMAVHAADIVISDDDIGRIPAIVRMGRRTLATIKTGIAFSLLVNTVAMALAVMGLMGPVAGALVHNIGSVIVIIGAAMLLRYDCWKDGEEDITVCPPSPGTV